VRDRLCELVLRYEDPYTLNEVIGARYVDSCGQFEDETDDDDCPAIEIGAIYDFAVWLAIMGGELIFFTVVYGICAVRQKKAADVIYNYLETSETQYGNGLGIGEAEGSIGEEARLNVAEGVSGGRASKGRLTHRTSKSKAMTKTSSKGKQPFFVVVN
jgi:hypothetical protein